MATFDELVELARNPAEGFTIDAAFIESLAEAHTVDVGGVAGQAEILTNDLIARDDAIAALTAEISALKASNYDLLTRLPNDNANSGDDNTTDDDTDDTPDIEDLFD